MSSILKALKKIDRRKAETRLPVWPYRINNRESMSRHSNRVLRRHTILGILIVVCTVALAGKLYFGSRAGSESIPHQAGLPVKSALPTTIAEGSKTDNLRAETNAATKAKPAPSSPTVNRHPPPRSPLDTSPAETVLKAAGVVHQTAPKDNAGLILQALVWSEQPEDRFVVVNDSILREGGIINGSVVSRIEPDYVTVRTGGITWRLKYGQ